MTNIYILIGISFISSIMANIFAFWYIRRLLSKLWFIAENLGDLTALVANYRDHLQTIYQIEDYYGDENIKFVLSHTASLVEILEEYEDVYNIVEEPIEETEEQQEETEEYAEKTIKEENVFYAGARRRDN